ncbi:MAG: DNA-binding protein HU-beta [candidate division BRC1 bacterium ADurb.BinA364]|nr:MAG: DNA-binding protein HU-beta [candidate division BRC1 bacterium ADurb.BinA364]
MATNQKPMTKAQLIAHLAEAADLQKAAVAKVLEELSATAYREAKAGFAIPGIGKLRVVERKERMGRNPQTNEPIQIPARTALKFTISKVCKDAVLKG